MGIPGKFSLGGKPNIFDNAKGINNILIGKVVSISDENGLGKIRVRIKGLDDHLDDSELAECFPLIPKFLNIFPVVGESVFIFRLDSTKKYDNRLWVGPIISQLQKLENDQHYVSSDKGFSFGLTTPEENVENVTLARGVYPKKDDVVLQSRGNNDITFKKEKIIIRNGKFKIEKRLEFNDQNPSYIMLVNNTILEKDEDREEIKRGGVANIVADKINLITHSGNDISFNLTDREENITEEELVKINSDAHPMVYGDKLLELLNLMIENSVSHIHPYHGKTSDKNQNLKNLLEFDLNSILSKNIKIL